MLKLILLSLWGMGAILLLKEDITKQEINLSIFLLYLISTTIYLLSNFYLFIINKLGFKIILFTIFASVLLFFKKKQAIAYADIFFILIYLIILPNTLFLTSLLIASALGIIYFFITKNKHIGFIGIYSIVIFLIILFQIIEPS